MSNETIDFNRMLKDSLETLRSPQTYFSSLPLTGGFAEPVIKAAIFGAVAGIFAFLWSILGWSAVGGGGIWGGAAGIMALIWSVIGAIIALFIGGAIMLVISAICGGNTDYEANVRVTASMMVMYPINAFFAFFYAINFTLGGLVGLLISCFSIYLLYHATIRALKGKESSVRIVAIVLLVLALIGFFGGRKVNRSFGNYQERFRQEQLN